MKIHRRFSKKSIFIFLIFLVFALVLVKSWLFSPPGSFPDLPPVSLGEFTNEDYLEDFDYVFNFLEETYPYFKVNEKLYYTDWLSNKEKYRNKIEKCTSDFQFYSTMQNILSDLHNGHTHLISENFAMEMYIVYHMNSPRIGWRLDIAKEYEKDHVRARYKINNESIEKAINEREDYFAEDSKPIGNVIVEDITDGVAYIKINQLLHGSIRKQDENIINPYLEKIKDYPVLIIDIRGNGGGDSNYYQRYLYPRIVDREYSTKQYLFQRTNNFPKINWQTGFSKIKDGQLEKLKFPEKTMDILDDFNYISESELKIHPSKDSINYKGNIYLLVDKEVYSSAESMASFTKETGLGTLIGDNTGGDGVGFDPVQVALPNTGYMLRFRLEMGVTESGSINELGTKPDIRCSTTENKPLKYQPCIQEVFKREGIEI